MTSQTRDWILSRRAAFAAALTLTASTTCTTSCSSACLQPGPGCIESEPGDAPVYSPFVVSPLGSNTICVGEQIRLLARVRSSCDGGVYAPRPTFVPSDPSVLTCNDDVCQGLRAGATNVRAVVDGRESSEPSDLTMQVRDCAEAGTDAAADSSAPDTTSGDAMDASSGQ